MEEILSLRCAVGGGGLHFLLIYRIQGIRIPLATATFHPHAIALPGVFLCANISKNILHISRDQEGLLLCAMTTAGANLSALPRQCETFSLIQALNMDTTCQ